MSNEELCVLIRQGDTGYLPQLWEQVRRFIAMKAKRFYSKLESNRGAELDDLIQSGYFAVLKAVQYYDPDKDHKFTTYLSNTLKTAFNEVAGAPRALTPCTPASRSMSRCPERTMTLPCWTLS